MYSHTTHAITAVKQVSLSDFLTLFSARTRGPFWEVKPGKLLLAAFVVAVSASTILACTWPFGEGARPIRSKVCGTFSSCVSFYIACTAVVIWLGVITLHSSSIGVQRMLLTHCVRSADLIYCYRLLCSFIHVQVVAFSQTDH
jgi:hypothetical protein